jgi:hypothetical protein
MRVDVSTSQQPCLGAGRGGEGAVEAPEAAVRVDQARHQGLTLVHLPDERKPFLRNKGCLQGV